MRDSPSTGEEWPGGSGVFQRTFFPGPKLTGRPVASDTPVPFGPRNRLHDSRPAADTAPQASDAPSATPIHCRIMLRIVTSDRAAADVVPLWSACCTGTACEVLT